MQRHAGARFEHLCRAICQQDRVVRGKSSNAFGSPAHRSAVMPPVRVAKRIRARRRRPRLPAFLPSKSFNARATGGVPCRNSALCFAERLAISAASLNVSLSSSSSSISPASRGINSNVSIAIELESTSWRVTIRKTSGRAFFGTFARSDDAAFEKLHAGLGVAHREPRPSSPQFRRSSADNICAAFGTASTNSRLTRSETPASEALISKAARFWSRESRPSFFASSVKASFFRLRSPP